MIVGYSAVVQAVLGTLFTWAVTALGAAVVYVVPSNIDPDRLRKLLDFSLGFSGGVMIAASYWSLLDPAFDFATQSGTYGDEGQFAWVPVAIGFTAGAAFVYVAGLFLPEPDAATIAGADSAALGTEDAETRKRRLFERNRSWRRVLLLVIAITVHNFPEGLAVGVGFAAVGSSKHATFAAARTLAIGIGLQNFPEGLAVSLPLMRAGYSRGRAFWYGQLSGMVEPLAGFLGAFMISLAYPFLPYALSFAAGAMIYVVVDDLVPEAYSGGVSKNSLCSWGVVVGFLVMMIMDVSLG